MLVLRPGKTAFDTVDHNLLWNKFYGMGYRCLINQLSKTYLTNILRKFKWRERSHFLTLTMLVTLRINFVTAFIWYVGVGDLATETLHSSCALYADDAALTSFEKIYCIRLQIQQIKKRKYKSYSSGTKSNQMQNVLSILVLLLTTSVTY